MSRRRQRYPGGRPGPKTFTPSLGGTDVHELRGSQKNFMQENFGLICRSLRTEDFLRISAEAGLVCQIFLRMCPCNLNESWQGKEDDSSISESVVDIYSDLNINLLGR